MLAFGQVITVTTTDNDGPGSLRQAIEDANAQPNVGTITFDIATGTAPFIITLSSDLPVISEDLTIDGSTQSGYTLAGGPVVQISGGDTQLEINGQGVNVAINALDLSHTTTDHEGTGLEFFTTAQGANGGSLSLTNSKISYRRRAIGLRGPGDVTLTNNDITNSGVQSNGAVRLLLMTGTLSMTETQWGGADAGRAIEVDRVDGVYIGDDAAGYSGSNFKIEVKGGEGFDNIDGANGYVVAFLNGVVGATLENLNLSAPPGSSTGNAVSFGSGTSGNVSVSNLIANRRFIGIFMGGSANYVLTNNDLRNTGSGGVFAALRLVNMTGSLIADGTLWGNGAGSGAAIRVEGTDNVYIADDATTHAGSDFRIQVDASDGLNTCDVGPVIYAKDAAGMTVKNVDLSDPSGQTSWGVQFQGAMSGAVVLDNVKVNSRSVGVELAGGRTIRCPASILPTPAPRTAFPPCV